MTTEKERMINSIIDLEHCEKAAAVKKESANLSGNFREYQNNGVIQETIAHSLRHMKLEVLNKYGVVL